MERQEGGIRQSLQWGWEGKEKESDEKEDERDEEWEHLYTGRVCARTAH